jgi:dienelactone hydrolase
LAGAGNFANYFGSDQKPLEQTMQALVRSLFPLLVLLGVSPAFAAVQDKIVDYQDGDTKLRGYLYWDDRYEAKRPGVLVVHEWWGLNAYARMRARMLAEAGYVAFAPDMYGADKVTEHADEAKGWMQQITANVDTWRKRAEAGLEQLKAQKQVDPSRLAAIGYCFGGSTVMQMAYAGMDLLGVASFHGSLPPATAEQQKNIKASVLVAHGDQDDFVPPERLDAFREALNAAGADWEINIYSGARHGFTVPDAERKGIDNLKYDPKADRRSWQRLLAFLDELLRD